MSSEIGLTAIEKGEVKTSVPVGATSRQRFTYIFKQLGRYATAYKLLITVAIILLATRLLLDVGIAVVQQLFINTINSADMDVLFRLISICVIITFILVICLMVHYFCRQMAESRMIKDLAVKVFAKTSRIPFRTMQSMHSGDLVSRNNLDVAKAMSMVGNVVFDLGYNLLLCLVAFLYLARMDVWLALLALGSGPVVFFAGRFFDRRLRSLSEVILRKEAEVRGLLQETLQGIKVVRAFGMEEALLKRYVAEREDLNKLLLRKTILNGLLWQSSALVNNLVMILCAGLISYAAIQGRMTAGEVLAFVILMGRVQWPFVGMSKTWGGVQEALGAADRVFAVLNMPSEPGSRDGAGGEMRLACDRNERPAGTPLSLSLRGINLAHPSQEGSEEMLFTDFNLDIAPGETVAVVGASGSGKTTLARLCCGLFTPDTGTVTVEGISLREHLDQAREHITYVPQAPYLFSGTIRANIAFGSEDTSEERIEEAARLAGAAGFIAKFPDGYNTVIGEHGSTLSGGQRQRIAIARAFLRKASLLILDEATSALDNESEQLVQESLDRLMQGRTTLVIAHRLATVRNATRIIVLDGGRITEEGTHDMLLARNGLYHDLYRVQFRDTVQEAVS
ncbi:MAG: ABC transporter ATP-binding protein/permease [Gorillibacterium sp.]|nr:ABC transporter ATP-binding protein/permease [Gorillibacterium sp.]